MIGFYAARGGKQGNMADEQPIYVSPQEELTSVLERLARTQARHITLVIPSQTQLHSHTGWRLIHARMREMGKELLVISPDRQVQALASAAGFKVAARLDGGTQTRSGSGSRSGSSNPRNGSRSRVGGSRGGAESQSTQQRRPTPSSHKRSTQPPSPSQVDFEDESTLERLGKRPALPRPSQPIAPAQPFEPPESKFGATYDFPVDTTPSLRPASLPFEEDDDDDEALQRKYADDYQEAQNIRASASKGPVMPEERRASTGRRKTDPYAHLEDDQPHSRLPEQRGSLRSPVEELGAGVPDLADYSTEIMSGEIEDLGDQGALDLPVSKLDPEPPAPREREQGLRPRARTGQMQPTTRHSPRAPRPGAQDFEEDDDDLLALPNQGPQAPRPSRGLGGTAGRPPSRGLAAAQSPRPSQGLRPAGAVPRPSQTLKPTSAASQAGSRRPASAPVGTTIQRAPNRRLMSRPAPTGGGRQASRPQSGPRRKGGGLRIFFGVVVALLCVALALFYFVPTATVTISLQAQTFSQKVQLTALTNPQANVPGAVAATKLQANFSANGQAKATGSTRVGNAQAQGLVTFTNNGSADVTIPTGTLVTTQSGLDFVTGAEAVIPYGGNVPAVPVTAQQSGDNGNVPANSITTIPTSSVNSIARYNKVSPASIKLTVANPQATSGGGALNEPAVTSGDVQGLEKTLHQKLQQQITAWLNQHVHSGDIHGATAPDVLGNSNPLSAEKLSGAPAVGQAVKSGTFNGTLSVQISVLVARTSDLQKAAGAQLNTAARKQNPPSILAAQLPVTLASVKSTTSADGNSLSITAQASGSIIQQVSTQEISNSLTGKGLTQAKSELQSSMARAGFLRVQISVSPGFLANLPLIAGHIQVILKPIQPTPPKHVPNG